MSFTKLIMKFSRIQNGVVGIIKKDGKVYLTKRSKLIVEGGKWCLPGGMIKKWETARNAVTREVKEETGFDVKKSKLLFVHEEFVKRLNLHAEVFVFLIEVSGKEKKNLEVKESEWFGKTEVLKLDMAYSHGEILERYFGGKDD
jgi:8-oxo-dGTP diphosphatase